jgi:hypothetical protein
MGQRPSHWRLNWILSLTSRIYLCSLNLDNLNAFGFLVWKNISGWQKGNHPSDIAVTVSVITPPTTCFWKLTSKPTLGCRIWIHHRNLVVSML